MYNQLDGHEDFKKSCLVSFAVKDDVLFAFYFDIIDEYEMVPNFIKNNENPITIDESIRFETGKYMECFPALQIFILLMD